MKTRLKKAGVKENNLPAIFRDKETARSRKGAAGQLVVKSMSGLQRNNAARLATKFENNLTEGREDIIEKLEMVPDEQQTKLQRHLINTMRENPRWSFGRCVAESKANLATTMNQYAHGLLALKKLESLTSLYREMPNLMRDVMHHAIDQMEVCNVCFGEGKVAGRAGGKSLNTPCPRCSGAGNVRTSSPHKAVALKEALEISKLKPQKGPLVAVQQNTQVNASGVDNNLLERMAKATDEVLWGDRDTIDAEIVYPDDIPVED
jgi:hypothetical protein